MRNQINRKRYDTYFSPKVSGIMSIIGATMLLVLNLQDGSILRAVLVGVVLASGIGMVLKS